MKYEIKYSSRKTISIKITRDAEVVVLAPYQTERSKIEDLIYKHEDWILSHLEKMKKRVRATPNFTDDEIIELKREAKVCLSSMVERFSKFMDLKYGRITITSAKSRYSEVIDLYFGPICSFNFSSTPPLIAYSKHFAKFALAPKNCISLPTTIEDTQQAMA